MHTKESEGSTDILNCFFSDIRYSLCLGSDCKSRNSSHSVAHFFSKINLNTQKLKFLYSIKTINDNIHSYYDTHRTLCFNVSKGS